MYRVTLICCEGKTEELYFKILRDRIFRVPGFIKISIQGEKGQHRTLIDNAVAARAALAAAEAVDPEEIGSWAVCDDDGMAIPFSKLERYAEEAGVKLAFSRPQFESFLLQHFEPSGETDQAELYRLLALHKQSLGYEGAYEKGNLEWLERTLVDKPKLVNTAIVNADQRARQASSPFFTVQGLVKYLKRLSRE